MEGSRDAGGAGNAGGTVKIRRLFIALPLPERVRGRLAILRDELPEQGFRGLKTDNFHITLVFLGDTPGSRIPDIEAEMKSAAEAAGPFAASLGGLGAFPHPREPRVVWAGLSRGGPAAGRLSDDLRGRLRRAGVDFDGKPFTAHITIAYSRRDIGRAGLAEAGRAFLDLLRRGLEAPRPDEAFELKEIILMESELRSGGSVFTPVIRIPLRNSE